MDCDMCGKELTEREVLSLEVDPVPLCGKCFDALYDDEEDGEDE